MVRTSDYLLPIVRYGIPKVFTNASFRKEHCVTNLIGNIVETALIF
jgi:hypothetical protein